MPVVIFFDIARYLPKKVNTFHIICSLVVAALLVMLFAAKIDFLLKLPVIIAVFSFFIFGLTIDRKTVYMFTFLLLALSMVLVFIDKLIIAENLVRGFIVLLVFIFIRDVVHETLFKD